MSNVQIVRYSQIAATRWKNGLGTTKQIAVHPENASTESFDWRVSIAHLEATAPFSRFEGVERCLVMLQGEMTLMFDSGNQQALTPSSPPMKFSGAEGAVGHVANGPALDLNVMYRVPGWRSTMKRMQFDVATQIQLEAMSLLCSLSDDIEAEIEGATFHLGRFDALVVADRAEIRIGGSNAVTVDAYITSFRRTS